jgi:hypothetical protein
MVQSDMAIFRFISMLEVVALVLSQQTIWQDTPQDTQLTKHSSHCSDGFISLKNQKTEDFT